MMRLSDAELATFVDLTARAVGLPLAVVANPDVLANARILAGHAERILAFELPPETPLATEFRP